MFAAILVSIAGLALFAWWKILVPIAQLLELSDDLSGARTGSRPEKRLAVAERAANPWRRALSRMPGHPSSFLS